MGMGMGTNLKKSGSTASFFLASCVKFITSIQFNSIQFFNNNNNNNNNNGGLENPLGGSSSLNLHYKHKIKYNKNI